MRNRIAISVIALGGLLLPSSAATALPQADEVENVATTIRQVAPGDSSPVQPQLLPGSATFSLSSAEVDLNGRASNAVTLATALDGDIAVSLPTELSPSNGQVASDGTVVFSDADADTHVGIQGLEDGSVRIQTVLEAESSPSSFTYVLDGGVSPVLRADGGADLGRVDQEVLAAAG